MFGALQGKQPIWSAFLLNWISEPYLVQALMKYILNPIAHSRDNTFPHKFENSGMSPCLTPGLNTVCGDINDIILQFKSNTSYLTSD